MEVTSFSESSVLTTAILHNFPKEGIFLNSPNLHVYRERLLCGRRNNSSSYSQAAGEVGSKFCFDLVVRIASAVRSCP
jgi:hypothetical protein